ncbi:DUF397 domain-containing protein [Amycolatopsis sp. NPDC023774]|uniref:DUF397 domain-containing protein n=1 Tax=Amycolatopsis sp. NPDC023774 TaxID=3155015 RepID=UPI0033D3A7C0
MLGSAWRKSSYTNTGQCVEVALQWQKSSYSQERQCVEVLLSRVVRVRDTKDRRGGELAVPPAAWAELVRKIG